MVSGNSAIRHPETDLANTRRDLVSGLSIEQLQYLPRWYLETFCGNFSTAQNIVTALPIASLAKGIRITGNLDPELKKTAQEVIFDQNPVELPGRPNLNASKYLRHAAIAAERIGGAALFLDIDDGQPPDQPVKVDKIKALRGIRYFDGFDVYPDWEHLGFWSGEVEPQYYRFLNAAWTAKQESGWLGRVHHSRVCPINGRRIMGKEIARNFNLGWTSDSSLRPAIRSILRLELILQANTNKAARSGVPVFKIADLIQNITQDASAQRAFEPTAPNNYNDLSFVERLKERLEQFAEHFSVHHVFAVDKEKEDLELKEFTFQGIGEIIEKLENALVMDTGLPTWKIYGQLKKSLGAQNEGEAREWESQVNEYRNGDLRSGIVKILTYWMLSKENQFTRGKLPDNWGLEFLPVWEQSGYDKAKEHQQEAVVVQTMQKVGQLANQQEAEGQQPVYSVAELRDWLREQDSSPGFDITLAESDEGESDVSDSCFTPDSLKQICPHGRRELAQEVARKQRAGENHSLELSTLQLMQRDRWDAEEQEKAKIVWQGWSDHLVSK